MCAQHSSRACPPERSANGEDGRFKSEEGTDGAPAPEEKLDRVEGMGRFGTHYTQYTHDTRLQVYRCTASVSHVFKIQKLALEGVNMRSARVMTV